MRQNGVRSAGEIAVIASSLNRTKVALIAAVCIVAALGAVGYAWLNRDAGIALSQQAEPTPIPGCPEGRTMRTGLNMSGQRSLLSYDGHQQYVDRYTGARQDRPPGRRTSSNWRARIEDDWKVTTVIDAEQFWTWGGSHT